MESREKRFGNSKYLTIYGVSTSNYSFFEKEMNRHYYILSVSEKKKRIEEMNLNIPSARNI